MQLCLGALRPMNGLALSQMPQPHLATNGQTAQRAGTESQLPAICDRSSQGQRFPGFRRSRPIHAYDADPSGAEEVWRCYSLLIQVEAAFRSFRSPSAEGPIFHQLEQLVQIHIFLALLAAVTVVSASASRGRDGPVTDGEARARQRLPAPQCRSGIRPAQIFFYSRNLLHGLRFKVSRFLG